MEAMLVTVTGRVHGVGFRVTTARLAGEAGLAGWVRNRPDGSVEVWAQGDEAPLEQLTDFLERGPSLARVTATTIVPVSPDPRLTSFTIRPTG